MKSVPPLPAIAPVRSVKVPGKLLTPVQPNSKPPVGARRFFQRRATRTVAAFDPNLPQAHTPIVAEELRNQFNGLAAMIAERATLQDVAAAGQIAVNQAQATSSNNSNAVGQLGMYADWNYNQSQMQALMDKMDELIAALRR